MSLHLWCCQGPHKPGSCANFMLNSHWGRAATGKKKSCTYAHRVASVVSNSLRPCRLAYLEKEMATHSSILAWSNSSSRLAYQVSLLWGGGSPGKNTGAYWPILAAIPL